MGPRTEPCGAPSLHILAALITVGDFWKRDFDNANELQSCWMLFVFV